VNEYEYEPIHGLPEELPDGEKIVWQGAPAWRGLARRVFRVHALAFYFTVLIAVHASYQWTQGADPAGLLSSALWQLSLAAVALGILSLMAMAYARSTVYTITNQRLVMRGGVAIPMMINIPWDRVQAADLRLCRDGTGDIALQLVADRRVAYWALWPNARPWHFGNVQPMLRGVESPESVANALARTVTGDTWVAADKTDKGNVMTGPAVTAS
jgi:hypothetical protein